MKKNTIKDDIIKMLSCESEDNSPTVEYLRKADFSVKEGQFRKRTIADRLYSSGRITQDEYDATVRWTTAYVVSYDGVGALQDRASTSEIKHDAISFALQMASAKDSIPAIKQEIGSVYHNILVLSCYYGYSASHLAKILAPNSSVQSAVIAVDRLCRDAYRRLYMAYLTLRKINKKT